MLLQRLSKQQQAPGKLNSVRTPYNLYVGQNSSKLTTQEEHAIASQHNSHSFILSV